MEKKKLNNKQIISRSIFMIVAIALVSYFFPRNDAFQYEFEIGKPWRYGRLSAPYDFAIYRSDEVIQRMEDSLHREIAIHFVVNEDIEKKQLTTVTTLRNKLPSEAYYNLQARLQTLYHQGILSRDDKDILSASFKDEAVIRQGNRSRIVNAASLLSEKEAYTQIISDTTYGSLFADIRLQTLLQPNLTIDSAGMNREYIRLRQGVSATSGMILAESRIIDRGEIVTPQIYDILNSYQKEQSKRRDYTGNDTLMEIGRIALIALLLSSILLFLKLYRPWIYRRETDTLVAISMVIIMVILTSLAADVLVNGAYLIPIGVVTIVLSTFYGSRTAFYCHIVMSLLCSFMAPSHFEYIIIQIIAGMIIVFSLKDGLTERSQLMRVCLFTAIGYCILYVLFTLANEGSLVSLPWFTLALLLTNALLLLMSYLIIYALEKMFGFMSGVTLVELCNLGKGLLLRLSQEAPGTFQHALQVANLTADAAKSIGANAQLVRTGALYHDIGKLWNPLYYTENQLNDNLHSKLTTEESVEVIKRHVEEGLRLAQKEKLPREIVDFITTHHGKGKIKFFYNTWRNEHPDEIPDEVLFTYNGPDPVTREQAILMMGDAVEAASKSLKDYSEKSIRQLVNSIIDGLVADGRFNNAKITLQDIQQVKMSFVHGLESIYHGRITYPTLKKR